MRLTRILVVAISLLSVSCRHETRNGAEYLVNQEEFVALEGERVYSNYHFLFPQKLVATNRNLLVKDKNDYGMLVSFPLKESASNHCFLGDYGMGPDDFMNMRTIAFNRSDSTLFIYDSTLKRAKWFDFSEESPTLCAANKKAEVSLMEIRGDVVPLGDRMATNMVTNGKMFSILSSEGKIKDCFGDYPGDNSGIENEVPFEMSHQFLMATNNEANRFVCAGIFCDWLAFYDVGGDDALLIKDYFTEESVVEISEKGSKIEPVVSMKKTPETKTFFTDILPSDSHVYAIYRGTSVQEEEKGKSKRTIVLKFDWEGNFIQGYYINESIGAKTVTPDGKYLIAVENEVDDESIIKRYSLAQ